MPPTEMSATLRLAFGHFRSPIDTPCGSGRERHNFRSLKFCASLDERCDVCSESQQKVVSCKEGVTQDEANKKFGDALLEWIARP
eukprot:4913316-Amphidinium_carterae.2